MDSKERNGHRGLIGRPMCFTTRQAELGNGMGRSDIIDERLMFNRASCKATRKACFSCCCRREPRCSSMALMLYA
jgi:hypothetical protein